MINKIKGIMQTEAKLDEINTKAEKSSSIMTEQTKQLGELKTEVSSLKQLLKELHQDTSEHNSEMIIQLQEIGSLKKAMERELYELKLLKKSFQKQLLDEMMTAFRDEISKQTIKLNTHIDGYNQLKDTLGGITSGLSSIDDELKKFVAISSKIKETDFDLTRYAQELSKADKEKVNLMRQLESMEKLVASERRKNRQTYR